MKNRELHNVYEKLGDEKSKGIFLNRVLFSITKDYKYISSIVDITEEGKEVNNFLKSYKERKKVIFGAGMMGKEYKRVFSSSNWDYFADNKVLAEKIDGIPVLSFRELQEKKDDVIVLISSRIYEEEIETQLLEAGFDHNYIFNVGALAQKMMNNQYFDLDYIWDDKRESFVDAGCYDGITSKRFIEKSGCCKMVWAFEPDLRNYQKCNKVLENVNSKVKIYPYGLWDKEAELKFSEDGTMGSKITNEGAYTIRTVALDDIISDKVAMIKMDIEGAEYKAIIGAEKIITQQHPALAISVYHKPEDIFEIPQLILSFDPTYRLFLRHYSLSYADTILYAI